MKKKKIYKINNEIVTEYEFYSMIQVCIEQNFSYYYEGHSIVEDELKNYGKCELMLDYKDELVFEMI